MSLLFLINSHPTNALISSVLAPRRACYISRNETWLELLLMKPFGQVIFVKPTAAMFLSIPAKYTPTIDNKLLRLRLE
ncbi:Uncharacterized protein HZ326_19345 [Fusarium oxysporum f. sp. albedinis]|nr:Uncharacterized protein HZ326_19345 [Fusarium oxysporum f. sp. albedinis]